MVIFSMAIIQLWIESHEVEGTGCKLFDTGQFIIGSTALGFMSTGFFSSIADIWVLVSVVWFFFWLTIDFSHREREFGRFFLVWGIVYFQRAMAIGATRYPLLAGNTATEFDNPFIGALLVTIGVMKTYSDFMFSGHTATWVVTGFFIFRYANNRFIAWLYIIFNCIGPFLLILVEEHYLADVIVGGLIGTWTFVGYHLINDSRFLNPFRSIWEIKMDKGRQVRIVYPIIMTDAEGNVWQIGENRGDIVELIGGETNPPRMAAWGLLKWFDGENDKKPIMRLLEKKPSAFNTRKQINIL